MKRALFLVATMSVLVGLFASCNKDEAKNSYYVPSEVALLSPDIASDLSVTLTARYNGDETGVASATFVVKNTETGAEVQTPKCTLSNGTATAVLKNLELGNVYSYNFEITTPGGNIIKAGTDETLAFCVPQDFVFSTQTTLSSKILTVSFTGADQFVKSVVLSMVDSEGNEVENAPEVICINGAVKALFNLSEWAQDLYECKLVITLYDGSEMESPVGKLNLLPVPENIVPKEITFDEDGVWTVTASYDGEDKTITGAQLTVFNKKNEQVFQTTATCAERLFTANVSGLEYGRYYLTYSLSIVDGTTLTLENQEYVYAKPRAYETYTMNFEEFYAGGVTDVSNADAERFTVKNVEWEDLYLQAKPTKTPPYAVWSSSKVGYLYNVTPFAKGIKYVHLKTSSGMKDISLYEGYGREDKDSDWVKLTGVMIDSKNYTWNLALGNYQHFKFMTTAQGEFRLVEVILEYFTEDAEEY